MLPEPSIMNAALKIGWLIWEIRSFNPYVISLTAFLKPSSSHTCINPQERTLSYSPNRGAGMCIHEFLSITHPREWILPVNNLLRPQKERYHPFNEIEKKSSHSLLQLHKEEKKQVSRCCFLCLELKINFV